MKAVIMAAGYGTRFFPITKTIAKEMLPIIDKPAIQFIIDELISAGIQDILIISHRKKKSLEDYFDKEPELETFLIQNKKMKELELIKPQEANIFFVRQKEMKGTGDALLLAESFIKDSPFILAYPDDIVLNEKNSLSKQLIEAYKKTSCSFLATETIPGDVSRFGVVKLGEKIDECSFKVKDIIEKPKVGQQPSQVISIGRYLLTADIFSILKTCPKKNINGEFMLTDALHVLAKNNQLCSYTYQGHRLDIGEPESYIRSLLYIISQNEQYKHLLGEV